MSYEIEYDDERETEDAAYAEYEAALRWRDEIEYQTRMALSVPHDQKQIEAEEWLERYG